MRRTLRAFCTPAPHDHILARVDYSGERSNLSGKEQVSDPSVLGWMYCNRTATGTVQFGTQRTQQMFGAGKDAANQQIYRTCQYGS
jgi:hypothetical protein